MKTLSDMFRALTFVLGRLHAAAQQPFNMKVARINLWTWGAVSSAAAVAIVMDYIVASRNGGWWDPWYLWNGAVLALDLTMLRAALVGYFYRRTVDAEKAEFEQIVSGL